MEVIAPLNLLAKNIKKNYYRSGDGRPGPGPLDSLYIILSMTRVQWRRAIEALEARAPPQTVWRLWLIVYRTELKVSLCA